MNPGTNRSDQPERLHDAIQRRTTSEEPESCPRVCTYRGLERRDPQSRKDANTGEGNSTSSNSLSSSRQVAVKLAVFPDERHLASGIHSQDYTTVLNTLHFLRYHFGTGRKPSFGYDHLAKLVELIDQDTRTDIQHQAALVLSSAIEVKENRLWAVEAGVCPVLLKMLTSGDTFMAEMAIGDLVSIVTGSSGNCDLLIKHGAVAALVTFVERNLSVEMLRTVSYCLRKIWRAYQSAPLQCKVITVFLPVVSQLLQHESTSVTSDVCLSLAMIANKIDRLCVEQMMNHGILNHLVATLCLSNDYDVIRPTLIVLACIVTSSDDHIKVLLSSRVLIAFHRLLEDGEFDANVSLTLDTISNIVARSNAHIQRVLDAGLTPLIIKCLQGRNIKAAVGTVFNLACGATDEQLELLIEREDALCHIIDILVRYTETELSTALIALKVFEKFMYFEVNRKRSRAFWEFVESQGSVDYLEALQTVQDEEIRHMAVRLVFWRWQIMKTHPALKKVIPKLDVLVDGLRSRDTQEVVDHLYMLRLLAEEHSLSFDQFIKLGGMHCLVQLLRASDEPQVHYGSIWLLSQILGGTAEQKRCVAEVESSDIFFRCLRSNDDTVVQIAADALLTMTSGGPELRNLLLSQGIVRSLTGLVDRCVEISERALASVAGCLNNLFCYRSHPAKPQVVKDCLQEIYQLLMQDESGPIVLYACWALENITYGQSKYEQADNEQIHAMVKQLDIVARLVNLIQISTKCNLLNSALMILGRISRHDPQRLISDGVLSGLKRLVASGLLHDIDVVAIVWIIENITNYSKDGIQSVIDEGLLAFVVESLSSNNVQSQRRAIQVLDHVLNDGTPDQTTRFLQEHDITDELIDLAVGYKDTELTCTAMKVLSAIVRLSKSLQKDEALFNSFGATDIIGKIEELQWRDNERVSALAKQLIDELLVLRQ